MVTAVDGLTFLIDGDGKLGIQRSLSPSFRFTPSLFVCICPWFFGCKWLMVSLQHSAISVWIVTHSWSY